MCSRPIFGFKRLESLLNQPAVNSLTSIQNDLEAWKCFLENDALFTSRKDNDDLLICMVVQILAQKVCSEDVLMESVRNDVLVATACCEKFIARIIKKINGFLFTTL
jgi:hypothetical protein